MRRYGRNRSVMTRRMTKKVSKEFPFSEEGKIAAVDWFNEQYKTRLAEWDAARHTDWSNLKI